MLDVKLKFQSGHADGGDWMAPGATKFLFWNVTRECNHRCPICFSDSGAADPDEMTTDEAKSMLLSALDAQIQEFVLSGGEPFLREDLPDLLAYMGSLGIAARIATNGTLLTDDLLARLRRDTLVKSFQISLDSMDPAVYATMRNASPEEHGSVLAAIRRSRAHGFHTSISIRLSPATIAGIPAVLDFASREGVPTVNLQPPVEAGRTKSEFPAGTDIVALLEPAIEHFLALPRAWRIETYIPWAPHHPLIRRLETRITFGHVGCCAARSAAVVQPSGRIVACLCMDVPGAFLGDVRRKPLRDILEDSAFRRMMLNPGAHGICADCPHVKTCGGGCRAAAYAATDRLNGPDPFCPLRNGRKD
ncbi:MAG: radical SAM protein [Planctomycetota bacterium]